VSSPVLAAAFGLREALARFEPAEFSGTDCAALAEELAVTEKACSSARLLAAARAAHTGAHRERGFKDGAAWLARQSGTTGSQAREALETAQRLEDCPDTKEALLAGQISLAQAAEITKAEAQTQGAEAELLPAARHCDLSQLRDHARHHRQAHTDASELRRRQYERREFRHWRDGDGMVRGAFALPPETGLPLVRRVEAAALRRRRAARAAGGSRERFEAHAADALADLVAGAVSGAELARPPEGVELVLVCDIFAWRRGHAHPGEVCQIIDGGPVPVEVARELAQDAFIKVALHDGVNIHSVKHFGRHLPAALRTALDLGPIPDFTGRQCVDCGSRWGLEYDHVNPVANQGPTAYDNLQARCYKDHQIKTEQDRQAGLLGPNPPRVTNKAPPNSP
jgi:Domain of unknown function (DUF222)/HNH endonuclease